MVTFTVGAGERDTRRRLGAPLEVFSTDLRLGLQSIVGVVVIMLLVITPSLYAWFNIAGSWDPYSRTDGLRVAVANEDQGFKGDLVPVRVSVGDTVVSQLHDNTNFDWQFVSSEEAVAGIEEGRYYASIVIPKDFSKNMLTYLTEDADYPEVLYYTNEKENPIAPLIMQKGADSIQEVICETFNERVDEVALGLTSEALGYLDRPQIADYTAKMSVRLDDAMFDMQEASSQMRSLADLAGMVAGIVETADTAIRGLASSAETTQQAIDQAEQGVTSAEQAFDQIDSLLETAVSQSAGGLDVVAADADDALAGRLAAPVEERKEAIFPVANYGSNMAPFYTVLSLWVGALVMISTMKTHLLPERAEELRRRYRLKPRHEYLGRLGIFSGIALLQALIVSLGDLCLLHIQCVHPVLFVLECVAIGQVFTLIVYTLSELFGDVGRALCVVLLIMQVAASGGTFPVEMLGVFKEVAVCLPFHQGMSALQGCVAGIYAMDTFLYMAALLVFVPVMLFMGVGIRKPLRRATDWLEAQLEKTNFM